MKSNLLILLFVFIIGLLSIFTVLIIKNQTNPTPSIDANIKALQKIVYHFQDASVPPKYHRSYTIEVTSDKAKMTVDSYGDIISEAEHNINNDQFITLSSLLDTYHISVKEQTNDEGCTGGTAESIYYKTIDGVEFDGFVYHCGGKDFGTLKGDISKFAEEIKKLVPDFADLLSK